MYVSANERSTFASLLVAANQEGTECYVGEDFSTKHQSSEFAPIEVSVPYDCFCVLDGENPCVIYQGKKYGRGFSTGNTYDNLRLLSSTDDLPSDLKDGEVVKVVSKYDQYSYGSVEVSVTNLENGYPNFEPTNGNYLVSKEVDWGEDRIGNIIQISTYNPLYKIVLHLTNDGFEKWLTVPQEAYTVDNDGIVYIQMGKLSLTFTQMTQEEIEAMDNGYNAGMSLYVVMEKTGRVVSNPMEVVTYMQKIELYEYLNGELIPVADEPKLQIIHAPVVSSIIELDREGQQSYKDGTLLLLRLYAENSPQDVAEIAGIVYLQGRYRSTEIKTFTEITDCNGSALAQGQYKLRADSQDTTRRPYVLALYEVGTTILRTLEANSLVQDFNALATRVTKIEPIQAGDVRQPTEAEVNNYGLSSDEYVISVEADSPPRSIEIQPSDSTFNIILKGLCPNEINIIFEGSVSIEFVGSTGYVENLSIIGNTPDFQAGTKYILSLKAMCGKFYAVYGTISEE